MVIGPHPITITVNDTDNSTAKQGAKVYVRNTTKKSTSAHVTTNVNGIVIIDLANLPLIAGQSNEYDDGDEILIISFWGNTHDAATYTVTGDSKSQTLNLNVSPHNAGIDVEKIYTLLVANTDASNTYYAKVIAVNDGQIVAHVECLAGDSIPVMYENGLPGSGGYVVVRENTALIVTTHRK